MDCGIPTIAGLMRRSLVLPAILLVCAGCEPSTEEKASPAQGTQQPSPTTAVSSAEVERAKQQGPENSVDISSRVTAIALSLAAPSTFPTFVPRNGEEHQFATILESLGSGVAAFDYDHDGWPDAMICGGGSFQGRMTIGRPSALFRNLRGREFFDGSVASGFPSMRRYNHAVAVNDIDNDGFEDMVVAGYQGLQLLRNLGDGTFEDATEGSGLVAPVWCASCAWGDFNRDSFPDLFVCGYVDWSFENDPPCYAADGKTRDNCSPKLFNAVRDSLFFGAGDGTWVDRTAEFHVRSDGKALGAIAADLDGDHWLDLYVGNDVMMNFLYRNVEGAEFEDRSISSGAGVSSRGSPDASMGVDVADYDGDGWFDLWAANFEMESFALYRNQGSLLFRHVSEATGVSAIGESYVGWGSAFVDLDLDGDEDMVVCNGNVVKYPQHSPALQRMVVLENIEKTHFEEVTKQAGEALMVPTNGRGLATTDWNRDGLPDLLTSPSEFSAQLLENQSTTRNSALWIQLVGTTNARTPVGTVLEARCGADSQWRQLKGGGSYASASLSEPMFAIHNSAAPVTLRVTWPDGRSVEYTRENQSGRIILREDSGDIFEWPQ